MFICPTTLKDWAPPFCPNPNCLHHKRLPDRWRYKKIGFYTRLAQPCRIQRFTCLHCRRSFSSQTFSTTYWQRLPWLDAELFMKTLGCMANRQAARDLDVAPETVNRHLGRLSRHCMLFHIGMMQRAKPATEIVIDGFESFEFSQYYPFHHHIAVEKGTDFFLYFTDSELRRKGRMTPYQKRRRDELEQKYGRPDPKAIEKDMAHLLETVLGPTTQARIFSDDHPAYRRPIRAFGNRVKHLVTPGQGAPGPKQPVVGSKPVGSVDPTRERESQAGDDRVVEAPAAQCRAVGDPARVAELHEGTAGEGARQSDPGDGAGDAGSATRCGDSAAGAFVPEPNRTAGPVGRILRINRFYAGSSRRTTP